MVSNYIEDNDNLYSYINNIEANTNEVNTNENNTNEIITNEINTNEINTNEINTNEVKQNKESSTIEQKSYQNQNESIFLYFLDVQVQHQELPFHNLYLLNHLTYI